MDASRLIAAFEARGFHLRPKDGDRLGVVPASQLTAEDRDLIREHKPGLLAELRRRDLSEVSLEPKGDGYTLTELEFHEDGRGFYTIPAGSPIQALEVKAIADPVERDRFEEVLKKDRMRARSAREAGERPDPVPIVVELGGKPRMLPPEVVRWSRRQQRQTWEVRA